MQTGLACTESRLEIPLEEQRGEKKCQVQDQSDCQHGDRVMMVTEPAVGLLSWLAWD
jgi:hypothetical protein